MTTPQLTPTFYIKRNDTRPFLDVELSDINDYPLNLSDPATTVAVRHAYPRSGRRDAQTQGRRL